MNTDETYWQKQNLTYIKDQLDMRVERIKYKRRWENNVETRLFGRVDEID